jgi:hypothetical protein
MSRDRVRLATQGQTLAREADDCDIVRGRKEDGLRGCMSRSISLMSRVWRGGGHQQPHWPRHLSQMACGHIEPE